MTVLLRADSPSHSQGCRGRMEALLTQPVWFFPTAAGRNVYSGKETFTGGMCVIVSAGSVFHFSLSLSVLTALTATTFELLKPAV